MARLERKGRKEEELLLRVNPIFMFATAMSHMGLTINPPGSVKICLLNQTSEKPLRIACLPTGQTQRSKLKEGALSWLGHVFCLCCYKFLRLPFRSTFKVGTAMTNFCKGDHSNKDGSETEERH